MRAEIEVVVVRGKYVVFVDFGDELVVDKVFKTQSEAFNRILKLKELFSIS